MGKRAHASAENELWNEIINGITTNNTMFIHVAYREWD